MKVSALHNVTGVNSKPNWSGVDLSIHDLIPITRDAGALALEIYNRPFSVDQKDDKSPVTEADLAVDALIVPAISRVFPDVRIVTEEQAATHGALEGLNRFLLVDPIDGTKEFIKKTDEFTINIALIENGIPVAGIVYAPALGRLFIGEAGNGAEEIDDLGNRKSITVKTVAGDEPVAVASKSHMTDETFAFLKLNNIGNYVSAGSSLKFCVVAAGEAHIYPRFGPTMEWDTAAGHAVLLAAGGEVFTEDQKQLKYGKPDFRNPNFIATNNNLKFICPK